MPNQFLSIVLFVLCNDKIKVEKYYIERAILKFRKQQVIGYIQGARKITLLTITADSAL